MWGSFLDKDTRIPQNLRHTIDLVGWGRFYGIPVFIIPVAGTTLPNTNSFALAVAHALSFQNVNLVHYSFSVLVAVAPPAQYHQGY